MTLIKNIRQSSVTVSWSKNEKKTLSTWLHVLGLVHILKPCNGLVELRHTKHTTYLKTNLLDSTVEVDM